VIPRAKRAAAERIQRRRSNGKAKNILPALEKKLFAKPPFTKLPSNPTEAGKADSGP
jgi:hypothetical protein